VPDFAGRVVAWQKAHGRRDLPWQNTADAYRIWLSEIMLQQTQVGTVIPYYLRFLDSFPDVHALAAAPIEAVMVHWAGLGYYSRARNLHQCARLVVKEHGGNFPRNAEALARLPGIGRSTAGAIAALAFGAREPILEGNVKRVLARQFGVAGYPGTASVQRVLWQLANQLLPPIQMQSYTQGLMDLGATVCTRSRPGCAACPVRETCVALAQGKVDVLPTPRPIKPRPVRSATVLVIRDAGSVMLEARPPAGIWGGLVSLPEFEADACDASIMTAVESRYGLVVEVADFLDDIRNEFTHYTYVLRPRIAWIKGVAGVAHSSLRALADHQLRDAPLPAPIRRLLLQITDPALV